MTIQIKELEAKTILTPQKIGAISGHYDYSLNPYAGCAFKCSYCYVPKFPNARHSPADWGGWVEVKVNAAKLLRQERLKIFGSRIFFSSATDPYQYIELKYRLSRQCLQELLRYQPAKVTMHTRSHLMLQDIELLKKFGSRIQVGVSITTDDDAIRQEFEPNAPSIARRCELIAELKRNGVEVYASLAPLLPCNPERLAAMITPYTRRAWVEPMNWTEVNNRPHLLEKYKDFFAAVNHEQVRKFLRQSFAGVA